MATARKTKIKIKKEKPREYVEDIPVLSNKEIRVMTEKQRESETQIKKPVIFSLVGQINSKHNHLLNAQVNSTINTTVN